MAARKRILKQTTTLTVNRKRGGGAVSVVVKLNGIVLPFNDNSDDDTITISADVPGTYNAIVVVREDRGSTGEAVFKNGAGDLLDLDCTVNNDLGIDHSTGSFSL